MELRSSSDFRAKLREDAIRIARIELFFKITMPSLTSLIGTKSCVAFDLIGIFLGCRFYVVGCREEINLFSIFITSCLLYYELQNDPNCHSRAGGNPDRID